MLEKKHCKATVLRSEVCTPAFAADSVRQFMRQASKHAVARCPSGLKPVSEVTLRLLQEAELAADVQRNLTAAIAALEELEQHRNPTLGPVAKQGAWSSFRKTVCKQKVQAEPHRLQKF